MNLSLLVDRVWARMVAYYGARFADAWRGVDVPAVKAVWAEEFAGYSLDEIKRGVDGLKGKDWPPTLPEFLSLCRPKPDPQAAHAEACRLIGQLSGWSDCSVFWAAREIGYHDLKAMPYRDIKGRWIDALERAWADRKPIPESKPVAGHIAPDAGPKPHPMTEEQRREMWERINAVGAKFKRKPRPEYQPDADDLAAMKAAEAEIEARKVGHE